MTRSSGWISRDAISDGANEATCGSGNAARLSPSANGLAVASGRVALYVIYLGLLAAFWGASYMFIKVAKRDFEPATPQPSAASR